MAAMLDWNDKVILQCRNGIFSILYEAMEDIIDENNIILNDALTEVMQHLDQAGYGIGFDLAEYLHTKEDILTLIILTRKALDKYRKKCQEWLQSLEELYKELIEIGESFPDNIIISNGKNTIIIRCETSVIEMVCLEFEKAVKESNSKLNENVTKAIKKLLAGNYDYHLGSIMAECLHTKEEAIVFTDLVRRAVVLRKQKSHEAQKITQDFLEGFYRELVKISESFNEFSTKDQ